MRAPSGLRTEPWASCWANRTENQVRVRDLRDDLCMSRFLCTADLHGELRAYGRFARPVLWAWDRRLYAHRRGPSRGEPRPRPPRRQDCLTRDWRTRFARFHLPHETEPQSWPGHWRPVRRAESYDSAWPLRHQTPALRTRAREVRIGYCAGWPVINRVHCLTTQERPRPWTAPVITISLPP